MGINAKASAVKVTNTANSIAMFSILDEMAPKGKLLNVAVTVSAAFTFGNHLGFTAGVNQEMVFPVILAKLAAGVTALLIANLLSPKLLGKFTAQRRTQSKRAECGWIYTSRLSFLRSIKQR